MNEEIPLSFPVGQAPWEINQETEVSPAVEVPQSFPVGQAPWEVGQLSEGEKVLMGMETISDQKPQGFVPEPSLAPEPVKGEAIDEDIAQQVTSVVEGGEQVVAGMRRPTAGLAKIINDSLAEAGLPNEKETTDKAVSMLSDFTERYNEEHPDQIIHPSTIGEMLSYSPVIGAGAVAGGASTGAISFITAIGSNKDYNQATKDGIMGAVLGGASIKVLNKIFSNSGPLTKEAKILLKLNQNRISETEAIKLLKDIPKEDQVINLAERIDLAKKFFKGTIEDDPILASKYGARLEARKNILEPFVANEQDLIQAKQTFGAMKSQIDAKSAGTFSTANITEGLDELANVYATDPAGLGTAIKQIKFDLKDNISAGQALDIRENINAILRKPSIKKSYKSSKVLGNIKEKLDAFLDMNLDASDAALIKTEINKYRQTINNKLFDDIIKKNTKSDFAVNWGGVIKDIKKEGINSDNIEMAMPILQEFEKHFHNDQFMATVITPEGSMDHLNALGVTSKILNTVLDTLSPLYSRSRYKSVLIRKAIKNSIKKSTNPMDFVEDLVKQKAITKEESAAIKAEIKPLMLEYTPIVYRASRSETHKSKGALGEGTYYFEKLSKAKERQVGTDKKLFKKVLKEKLATFEDISKILGRKPKYKDLRDPKVKQQIIDAGFGGVTDSGEMIVY